MVLSRDRGFYRQVFRLTGFIALQNVITCLVGLADNIMIGGYSQAALSGVTLANQMQFFLQMLVGGVAEGMGVLVAQYWGTRRIEPIKKILAIALTLAAAMGVLLFAGVLIAPEGLLRLLTTDGEIIGEGTAYLRIVCFSYVPFCIGNVLVCAQRCVEKVKVGTYAVLSGLVVNIVLNYGLIYGNLGMPELGARGAAIATLIARLVEAAIVVWFTYGIDKRLAIRWRHICHLDGPLFKDYLRVGTPVFLASASWAVAMTVQAAILGHLGSNAVAANAIANSLFQVISVVAYGMASASGIIIGKAVGRDDRDRLKEYVNTLQVLYLGIGLLSGLLMFLFRGLIVRAFSVTPEAKQMAEGFIMVLSVTLMGTAYQCPCLTGIVRGGGNTKFVFYNDLIFMWGIVLPMSLLAAFVFKWNPVWVFACLKADQVLKCFVAVWQVNSYHWVRKVTREERPAEA